MASLDTPFRKPEDPRPSSSTHLHRRVSTKGLVLFLAASWIVCYSPNIFFEKIKPIHPIHNGRVVYTVTDDPKQGRIYHRQFTSKCGYGILAFNIGPAKTYLPYDFDVYNDESTYSDNQGLCWLYPTYKGVEKGPFPFWMPDDPTLVIIPFGNITRISSRVLQFPDTKPLTDAMKPRCGDYALLAKGNFYSAHFYQLLKDQVHQWKADSDDVDVGVDIEDFVRALQSQLAADTVSRY